MKKILVVDDDKAHRMMLIAVLSDEGYTVAEADDGTMAVQAVNEEFPPVFELRGRFRAPVNFHHISEYQGKDDG